MKNTLPANTAAAQSETAGPGAQTPISCAPQLVNKGLDTIHVSLSLNVPESLLESLKEAKAKIQAGEETSALWQFGQTTLFSFELSRTGVILYPYLLKMGDISFALSNRKAGSRIPNAALSIGSLSCNNGVLDLLQTFRRWLKLHNIELVKETVSRADVYADYATSIDGLHIISQSRMVTQARKVSYYYSNRKLTGVQVGTSAIVLRMYDKIQEMKDKCATQKQEFFDKLWGGTPEAVTRVEFQLRREALSHFFPESCTVQELHDQLAELWKYLSEKWFRQTARAVDRNNNNQSRETTSPFWSAVQQAFATLHNALERTKKLKVFNLKALVQQAGGIMVTIAAGLGAAYEDLPGMLHLMDETIGRQLESILDKRGEKDFYRRAAVSCLNI